MSKTFVELTQDAVQNFGTTFGLKGDMKAIAKAKKVSPTYLRRWAVIKAATTAGITRDKAEEKLLAHENVLKKARAQKRAQDSGKVFDEAEFKPMGTLGVGYYDFVAELAKFPELSLPGLQGIAVAGKDPFESIGDLFADEIEKIQEKTEESAEVQSEESAI
jgi:hypothetical protein